MSKPRSWLGLGTALAAGVALLMLPAGGNARPAAPVTAAVAWPQAQRGTVQATLADGAEYRPGLFLDAHTSIGTAASPDGRYLRLVRVGADGAVRQLRRLPRDRHPSFQALTAADGVLAWVESTDGGTLQLWTAGPGDGRAPRELTADLGRAEFYQSQYDLVVAGGRVHWVAAGGGDVTRVRSVALTGGPVSTRDEPGTWKLSAYPWLVNGVNDTTGSTLLLDLGTGRDTAVRRPRERATTACSPAWCRVVSLTGEGRNRIELMRPDGSARRQVAGDTAATVIVDVAPLDRFEVLARIGPNSELTGNNELIAVELATRRTVQVSPDAGSVSYRGGMLWWSTGNLDAIVWHALDLRTA
ncbi:hypothetical protein Ani05nite_25490 [Amorphoplanes nipponensis]|uniref:Uncharacterized protein n=1 Tax=Actinoplanes nipponensis TaxID=135950 RepID=A0A919JGL0_9ACTN|nr:hypothetical protein [Actinoplanes nipponensis]GIE49015.1 hypothetical protein Ani05nite_25490 [Actinoplanes nipponensis]